MTMRERQATQLFIHCFILIFGVALLPLGAWGQLDFLGSDLVMKHVNFVRGDIEITDPNTENERLSYTNPDGMVELQIVTDESVFDVRAKTIELSSGQNRVLAQNVLIDDGTTSVRGDKGSYLIEQGKVEFVGRASFKQKLDDERANEWSGEAIQLLFADGIVKKITLKGGTVSGHGRLYPQKGQMGRYLPGYKKTQTESQQGTAEKKQPEEPAPTPTAKPLERILAPMAE